MGFAVTSFIRFEEVGSILVSDCLSVDASVYQIWFLMLLHVCGVNQ